MKALISGFKFGMMLQFAIGPITLFVFQVSVASGFGAGVMGMIGATLADALFVAAAILGLGAVIHNYVGLQKYMKLFGAIIMVIFGTYIVLSSLGLQVLSAPNSLDAGSYDSIILKVFILTIANPMTVLYWTGIFATQIIEKQMHTKDLWIFAFGAVATTAMALTLVAAVGSGLKVFVGPTVLTVLNVLVGIVLVVFGVKILDKKKDKLVIE